MVNLHLVWIPWGRSYQTSINLVDIGKVHKVIFLTLFKQIYPVGTSFQRQVYQKYVVLGRVMPIYSKSSIYSNIRWSIHLNALQSTFATEPSIGIEFLAWTLVGMT